MPFITTADETRIFYKDWGSGQPVVFSHGWPLNADAWDRQLNLVASHGFRGIAHDRRGHGRSTQTWDGNDMDTYADDLAALIGALDLTDVVLVGHSTGGGEVTRYLGRHGTGRVAKAVLLGAVPPPHAPHPGQPRRRPDRGVGPDPRRAPRRPVAVLPGPVGRVLRREPGRLDVDPGVRDQFWRLSMQAGLKAAYDCVEQFSETDFTADLRSIDVPVLVVHGDDDQMVPIGPSALRTVELLPDATLVVHEGRPHGLFGDYETEFEEDLLAFLRS